MTTTAPADTLPAGLGQDPYTVDNADADDLTLWSVTTIIGVLDKPALLFWSAQQAAEAAVDAQSTWQAMLDERGRAEAVKWLRDARFRRPRDLLSAADLGVAVHKLCETYALTGTRPDKNDVADTIRRIGGTNIDIAAEGPVVWQMLDRFDDWLGRFSPSYQAAEIAVYSPTYGVAGTLDALLTIDGTRFIADTKTTREPYDSRGKPKTPYPEVGLQLAAYRHMEYAAVWRPRRTEKFRRRYYLLSEAERAMAVPVPEVDGGLCIHITPEACEAYPVRCDQPVHRAFLHILEVARWRFVDERTVIGAPLERPTGTTQGAVN